jgi:TetR/AcrR family fatty acid metabolism transcriptional regulator
VPKVVDAAAQRLEIRRAARQVFARRGVAGTGLAHVADAAGMGRSSLYHYYPDKEALLRDLVRDLLAEEERLFDAALDGRGSALARIDRLGAELTGVFDDWVSAGRLLSELRTRWAGLFRPFFRRVRRRLASLIAEGQRDGEIDRSLDPELAAAVAIGAIDGVLLQVLVDPRALTASGALRDTLVRALHKALAP